MSDKNQIYSMLNNIYEMERTIIPLLENQARDAKNYPHIGKYLKKLLKESQSQALKAKDYMDMLKGTVKSDIDMLVDEVQKTTHAISSQELVTN